MSWKIHVYRFAKSIAGLILTFNVLSFIWISIYASVPIRLTKRMVIEKHTKDIDYRWVPLEQISGNLQLAVMCAEDQYFLMHSGLDFQSIDQAVASNKLGKSVKGASTITQQVAKNVFLWPSRDWVRKGFELYFSLLVDAMWSKERIMEVYLNIAEMGDGIFGVEAASQQYFKKAASEVSQSEAALLAAILPSPKRYSAIQPGPYVRKRQQWILTQMGHWGNEMTYDKRFVENMLQ